MADQTEPHVRVTLPQEVAADLVARLEFFVGQQDNAWATWLGRSTEALGPLCDVITYDDAEAARARAAALFREVGFHER